ncbi:ATP-dependent DNA helicase RecG [Lachnospiraceae bacterium KH1T2]|nr:ATP-dependent DNA helicase RecG [Lachnospiraceae bacterium KH1T2]
MYGMNEKKYDYAGILFVDQWNIHHSRIFCTRWNGLEKANSAQDALDDAEYTGGLLELYDNTMSFIKNNTKKGWRKDNDRRVELPDEGVIERIG